MPYPFFHIARILEPSKFEKDSFKTKELTSGIESIMGRQKDSDVMIIQSYHFDKDKFSSTEAKKWLKEHKIDYIDFESAKTEKNNMLTGNKALKAKRYSGSFLRVGPASYPEDQEKVCIRDYASLMRIAKTHIGVPIVIDHKMIDDSNIEDEIVGRATNVFLNNQGFTDSNGIEHPMDGYAWVDFLVDDPKAMNLLDNKGWRLSNSYIPTQTTNGGTWSADDYDYEILAGEANHIAIVESPRYEDVKVISNSFSKQPTQLNNNSPMSKISNKIKNAFDMFKNAIEEEDKVDNKLNDDVNTLDVIDEKKKDNKRSFIRNDDGEKEDFETIKNAVQEMLKCNDDDLMTEEDLNNEYDMGNGTKMTGHEILNMYKQNKQNDGDSSNEVDKVDKIENDDTIDQELADNESQEQVTNKKVRNNTTSKVKSFALKNAREEYIQNEYNKSKQTENISQGRYIDPAILGSAY